MAVDSKLPALASNSDSSVKSLTGSQLTHHAVSGTKHYWKCKFPECSFSTKYKRYLTTRHFLKHDQNLEVRKPFACAFDDCKYRAAERGTLNRHIQTKHTPNKVRKFPCSLCPSRFASESLLRAHIPQHLKEKSLKCVFCKFSTHSKESLRAHVRAQHEKSVTFNCPHPGCQYKTSFRKNLNRHRKIHEPNPLRKRPLPCNFSNCTFRAYNPGHLKIHVATHHNPNRRKEHLCPLCSKAFYTHQVVSSHIRSVHTREKPFRCDKCSFKAHHSTGLTSHRKIVHQDGKFREKKFKCESCDYCTDGRMHLDLHQKSVHSSERKLLCDVSGCQFKTNHAVALRAHRLIHETEPERRFPFACTFPGCDFRRRLRTKLKKHVQNHHSSKKQLRCPFCPNKYPDRISFNFHKDLIHNEKTCYRCPNCNFNVRFKRHLNNHMRNHCLRTDLSHQQKSVAALSGTEFSRLGEISLAQIGIQRLRVPVVIIERVSIKNG